MIVLLSGGLDSSTVAYMAVNALRDPTNPIFQACTVPVVRAITFDHGQKRWPKELEASRAICDKLGIVQYIVDISDAGWLFRIPRPKTDEVIKPAPFRNGVFLAYAAALAGWLGDGENAFAYGTYAGAHEIFPDCRPSFIATMRDSISEGLGYECHIYAPLLNLSKKAIVMAGSAIGVPYGLTRSCYEPGDRHCGVCRACLARKRGFAESGITDPTAYQETEA